MTNEDLIRDYLAKGGTVTRCRTKPPRYIYGAKVDPFARYAWKERHLASKPVPKIRSKGHKGGERDLMLLGYLNHWQHFVTALPGHVGDVDWWASYDVGPCDPHRKVAEAAAIYVIARDEGLESARLYEQNLCAVGKRNEARV